MKTINRTIQRAFISVSNKTGLIELAEALVANNIEIISTGGTSQFLRAAHVPVVEVSEVTHFPEMMEGRVKTLHPFIHGGILGKRDDHAEEANAHHIRWIDLVIVNLYPFAETIQKNATSFEEAIKQIDIGGPTLIRGAAKNMAWVTVIVDPNDYPWLITELQNNQEIPFASRQALAAKAFSYTSEYDHVIQTYLQKEHAYLNLKFKKVSELRYGENPHQKATAFQLAHTALGVFAAKQLQGKALSYNNLLDADAVITCLQEFTTPACVIVKHGNPCGVALGQEIIPVFQAAYAADDVSAFGGIVACNRPCDEALAKTLLAHFFEVIIAPHFSQTALKLFAEKPNLRLLEIDFSSLEQISTEYRFIEGGLLLQDKNNSRVTRDHLQCVTQKKPTEKEITSLLFANQVVKYIKSNAIVIAKNNVTVGIGAGQMSRVDAVEIAIKKSKQNCHGAVLASDAFFPFRDSIDYIAKAGIQAIIQPGGSLRDQEVIEACNTYGISMVLTGVRAFKH